MVFLETSPHLGNVDAFGRGSRPRQVHEPLDVATGNLIFGGLCWDPREPTELFACSSFGFLRHFGPLDALAEFVELLILRRFPEFVANTS
ncbi:MAG: hypothetical protein QM784_00640 [Polyangiaceae bacterium]